MILELIKFALVRLLSDVLQFGLAWTEHWFNSQVEAMLARQP